MDKENSKSPFDLPAEKIVITESDKGSLELKTQEFMPTILIGIGGTGKEVLLRIRRQFTERYGSISDFPIAAYLYIDTDAAPSEESGLARERDFLINEIDFKPNEKVFNPVNPADYIQSIQNVPHIKRWLNTSGEIGKLGTMNTGAGQIRPAARLALFHNYDEIVSKLTSAKARITDSRSINTVKDKYKIKNVTTEKINIYVITSVSGGTGSGMFIDMGFILRNLFKNQAITTSYLLLPKIFQGYGKERVYANGYAAMKELEHFNFKNKFAVSWKKNEEKTFLPGVYDDVYLIDGENFKNLSLSDLSSKDIFKMVADTIFQDFSNSDFANYKRGVRVNLTQYKQRFFPEDTNSSDNLYSRRYSTLGQATISLPADRIILSCTYKLCKDIMDYYLSFAEGSQTEIDNYLISEFLPEIGLLESRNRHLLLDSLYSIGGKSSIQVSIKKFLNNIKNELFEGKHGDNWTSYLISEKQKFDTNFKDDNDVNRMGTFISQIHSNHKNIVDTLIGKRESGHTGLLETKINKLINDSTRGVFYSKSLLRRFQFILTNENFDYIPALEKQIKELQSLAARFEGEVKSRLQDLKEDESRSKLNILRKASMQGTLEKLLTALEEYYNIIIKIKARIYAVDICKRILNLIEKAEKTDTGKVRFTGLIADINKLTGNLGNLSGYFEKKYEYFSAKTDNSFNIYIYEPEDIENEYYPKYIGTGPSATDKIKSLSYDLLKVLGASNITDIVNILRNSDASSVEQSMVKFCKKVFEGIKDDYDILEILFEKETLKSESKIRGGIEQAFPWLRVNEIPGRFKLDESAKKFYIGVKTSSSDFDKFRSLIYSITGSNVEFKDSADGTSIVFYTEWAGFPLFYSYTISEEMKQYYISLSKNSNIDLHIDKNYFIFRDIIPMTSEEKKRYEESSRAFLLGVIFGIFDTAEETDAITGEKRIIYKYTKQEGITVKRTEQLGIESRLINRLFEEQGKDSLRYDILRKAESIYEEFISKKYYAELIAIFEYYFDVVYKPEEIESSGGAKRIIESYRYRLMKDMANNVISKILPEEKSEVTIKIKNLKLYPDSFSYLNGDGNKRVLKVSEILNSPAEYKQTSDEESISLNRLRELKQAFDEGLISKEEFENSKKKFLNK